MATKRKSTKRKSSRPKTEDIRKVEEFRTELMLWGVIAVSALLFISNFGIGGIVGNFVSSILFGLFGVIAYIFPIILMVGCFFTVSNRDNVFAMVKLVAGCFFAAFLCMFVALLASGDMVMDPVESFRYGMENKSGGGIIGGFLAYFTSQAFDVVGAYIIDIVAMIICFVCITGKSAIKGFRDSGEKVFQSAKESNERYKEYKKVVAEEREKNRRLIRKYRAFLLTQKSWISRKQLILKNQVCLINLTV